MSDAPVLHSSVERLEAFRVAGLVGRFDPASYLTISQMWGRFTALMPFEGMLGGGETVGVFAERDHAAGSFLHLAGARVAPEAVGSLVQQAVTRQNAADLLLAMQREDLGSVWRRSWLPYWITAGAAAAALLAAVAVVRFSSKE